MAVEAPKTGLAHAVFLNRVMCKPATSPEVRLGQGAFLALRLADLLAADREPVRPDVFHYQWTATDRYCRELAHEGAEAAHLNGIVSSAGEAYRQRELGLVLPALFAYAYHLEDSLLLEEALDVLETIARVGGDRASAKDAIAARLRLGHLNRSLTRFDEADAAFLAAERLAEAAQDRHAVLMSRLGRTSALMRRGNLTEAERCLYAILADARGIGCRDAEARAEHLLGNVLDMRGQPAESAAHFLKSFELYEDATLQLRALGDLGIVLLRLGAVESAEKALHHCVLRGRQADVILNAKIELMHCASYRRDRLTFERWRQECDSVADGAPPNVATDFYLKAGIGYARFGHFRKADQHLKQAIALASAHRLHEFEFRIERIKAGLGDCEEVAREGLQATAEPVLQNAALREVSASLALLGA